MLAELPDDSIEIDLDDYGLFDPAVQQCPHAYYAEMRTSAPVFANGAGPSPPTTSLPALTSW